MNKIARKLVLSALTVVLTVVALGTTTFAWFTLTNTAVVQPFQASIVADTGIEVSLDGVTWYTTLTETVIEQYIVTTYGSFAFSHVTTATGSGNFNTLGASGLGAAAAGWLQIPLYFRSNSATKINWAGVTLSSTSQQWTTDIGFLPTVGAAVGTGAILDIDASNAMRISVTGNVGPVVFEKADGLNDNVYLGGDGTTGVDYSNGGIGAAGSYNYYYAKTSGLITGTNSVIVAPTETVINNTEFPLESGLYPNHKLVLNMTEDSTYNTTYWGLVQVRIWVEGWDADAYNSILAREITAGFTFVGA